jgi:hypothetical protein
VNTAKYLLKPAGFERERLEEKYKNTISVNTLLSRRLVSFQANKKFLFTAGLLSRKDFPQR